MRWLDEDIKLRETHLLRGWVGYSSNAHIVVLHEINSLFFVEMPVSVAIRETFNGENIGSSLAKSFVHAEHVNLVCVEDSSQVCVTYNFALVRRIL